MESSENKPRLPRTSRNYHDGMEARTGLKTGHLKLHAVTSPVPTPTPAALLVARCHEIQVSLGAKEVPEFESIPEIGGIVRLALHIRGLGPIDYGTLKLVANHFLSIPTLGVERIVRSLAEIEFVRLVTEGQTIKQVVPTVPYYQDMYEDLGQYVGTTRSFNEPEQLAINLVHRLARSPENLEALRNSSGAESKLFARSVMIGKQGNYFIGSSL